MYRNIMPSAVTLWDSRLTTRSEMSASSKEDIKLPGAHMRRISFFLCGQLILLIVRHIDIRWNEKHKYQKIIQIDQQITKLDIVFFFVLVNVLHSTVSRHSDTTASYDDSRRQMIVACLVRYSGYGRISEVEL